VYIDSVARVVYAALPEVSRSPWTDRGGGGAESSIHMIVLIAPSPEKGPRTLAFLLSKRVTGMFASHAEAYSQTGKVLFIRELRDKLRYLRSSTRSRILCGALARQHQSGKVL
jgi:hypothetical protein